MKRLLAQKIRDLFTPKAYYDLDVYKVLDVLKDDVVRKTWLFNVLEELKRLNMSIDSQILKGESSNIENLSGRRQSLQLVLEAALSAQNEVQRARGHNPQSEAQFDLESVTVEPSPH